MVETALTASTASLATVRALDLQGVTAKQVSTQGRKFDISKKTKLDPVKNLIPAIRIHVRIHLNA